jgi:hypothetical protein
MTNAEAAQRSTPLTVGGSFLQGQQFEERLRIAERIAQVLREAGCSCEIAYSGKGVPSHH